MLIQASYHLLRLAGLSSAVVYRPRFSGGPPATSLFHPDEILADLTKATAPVEKNQLIADQKFRVNQGRSTGNNGDNSSAGTANQFSKRDNNTCPEYHYQSITIPVHVRLYWWNGWRLNGDKRVSPTSYGSHEQDVGKETVASLNRDFAGKTPSIKFVLASGDTDETAGQLWMGYNTFEKWNNTDIGPEAGGAIVSADSRGPFNTWPTDYLKQLWIYSVHKVHYPGGDAITWSSKPSIPQQKNTDGIFIQTEYLSPFDDPEYSMPHLLTQEVGYWLGLEDFSQGGCSAPNDWWHGDGIPDTIPWSNQGDAPFSCPASSVSFDSQKNMNLCGSPATAETVQSGVTNFMTSSDPDCGDHFTQQQHDRMWKIATEYRGLVPTCIPDYTF